MKDRRRKRDKTRGLQPVQLWLNICINSICNILLILPEKDLKTLQELRMLSLSHNSHKSLRVLYGSVFQKSGVVSESVSDKVTYTSVMGTAKNLGVVKTIEN